MKLIFVENAVGKGISVNADKNGVGILVNPIDYKDQGNEWDFNDVIVKIKHCYPDDFEIIEEFNDATVYASVVYDSETYENADEAYVAGELSNLFYVLPKKKSYPVTYCHRFNNIEAAMKKVNCLAYDL